MTYFYQPDVSQGHNILEGEEMAHCARVLRKRVGDSIGILDGKGGLFNTKIESIDSKKLTFSLVDSFEIAAKTFRHHIAISPTKNTDRIEWFVEKACELGLDEISFVFTKNSERKHLKTDRLIKKSISALKQSKSGFITKINEAVKLDAFFDQHSNSLNQKYLAYVGDGLPYYTDFITDNKSILTLIGPEGDFTPEEIKKSVLHGFQHISLGQNVLRTETAGIVACQFVNMINKY